MATATTKKASGSTAPKVRRAATSRSAAPATDAPKAARSVSRDRFAVKRHIPGATDVPERSASSERKSFGPPEDVIAPHFPIAVDVYEDASDRAAQEQMTVSHVVNYGLLEFARRDPSGISSGDVARVSRRREIPSASVEVMQELLTAASETLDFEERARKNEQLNWYMLELADEGYAITGMARAVGISRQAASQRVATASAYREGGYDRPKGTPRPVANRERKQILAKIPPREYARSDRGLRISESIYRAAMHRYNSLGLEAGQVIEAILVDYIAGRLKVPVGAGSWSAAGRLG